MPIFGTVIGLEIFNEERPNMLKRLDVKVAIYNSISIHNKAHASFHNSESGIKNLIDRIVLRQNLPSNNGRTQPFILIVLIFLTLIHQSCLPKQRESDKPISSKLLFFINLKLFR